MTRQMIAAMQVTLDGFTQGSDQGGPEWVKSWADALALVPDVDGFVQGAGMYPGYGAYWSAILADPAALTPYQGRVATEREVAYARFAEKTPHYVLSRTLDGVAWPPTARIVRDVAELAALKRQPGKNLYVVGGPTLVTTLLDAGLLDELRLIVHPLLLAGGKPLFAGLRAARRLELRGAEPARAGRVVLTYRFGAA